MCLYIDLHVHHQSLQLSITKTATKSFLPSRPAITFSVIFRVIFALQTALIPSLFLALHSKCFRGPLPFPHCLPVVPQEFSGCKGSGTCQLWINTLSLQRCRGCLMLTVTPQHHGRLQQPVWDVLGWTDWIHLSQVFDPHDLYTGDQFFKVLSTLTAVNKATEGEKNGVLLLSFQTISRVYAGLVFNFC